MSKKHWAVFIDNNSDKEALINALLDGNHPAGFEELSGTGHLFSKLALERFIDEEERHGTKSLSDQTSQALKTMSSGEQKKALLSYILNARPDFIILDNPFDNLDTGTQIALKKQLGRICSTTSMVQLISRKIDLLPFIDTFARLKEQNLTFIPHPNENQSQLIFHKFQDDIPPPLHQIDYVGVNLIELRNINVSYLEKPILKQIDWTIRKGEFWELRGANGSGKTTILSMITGENPKGYGQDLYIFGQRKGSGESVWDIKKKIGYFTPAMTDKFTGYHTVENMIISGLNDSIGLYLKPTEIQLRLAKAWLILINMWHKKDLLYHDLGMGQKRLVMCIRAMIKHPILLILDEPTAGLDDPSAKLFVDLVNKFSRESNSTIIFVSHRKEPGLAPNFIYELEMTPAGSTGRLV